MDATDNSTSIPPEPPPSFSLTPDNPTPQNYGFPLNPNPAQRRCWANQERFLAALATVPGPYAAIRTTGISVGEYEEWRSRDKFGFLKRFAIAEAQYLESLQAEVVRRGRDGVLEQVYWRGQVVGDVRKYSDNLLMFEVKKRDPEYRDNYQIVLPDSTPLRMLEMMRSIGQASTGKGQPQLPPPRVRGEDTPEIVEAEAEKEGET